tara:strand:+ start:966 stop:2624 length:1659 start_codon:yes stop_codon:yes gene_type:complete
MADNGGIKLFGFELRRVKDEKNKKLLSVVPKVDDDGAGYVTAAGSHYGQFLNIEGDDSKDNTQLVMKYRGVAFQPEVDMAVEDIINEAISGSEIKASVNLVLDNLQGVSQTIKNQLNEEFNNVTQMLNFEELGHDIFRRWYVDGRIYYHLVVDDSNLSAGIQEVRPIDAAKIRKVKQVKKKKDQETGANLVEKTDEYFIFQEKSGSNYSGGVKISTDAICYVTSGLLSEDKKRVVSYLHKALKAINQLRMMEDSLVIYRLARAPERRIFYIDVGNLPRGKAEQYLKDIMTRYRNKLVYDAKTGEIKDDRKHMSMLEDFWLPRREGGRGTEITTLPGGDNLGQIDDIIYFQKKLYQSLNVPMSRLDQEQVSGILGRATEISRDELKFQKFIDRLRKRFSKVFLEILEKQCILKGITTPDDWKSWKNKIIVDYVRDNHFAELRDTEMLRERIQTLETLQNAQLVGTYFSKDWVMKNVLRMSDEDVQEMQKQIKGEADSGETEEPDDNQQEDYYEEIPEIIEQIDPIDEESKILDNKVKEKELQVLENVAQALVN